jgi:hypothetical protein
MDNELERIWKEAVVAYFKITRMAEVSAAWVEIFIPEAPSIKLEY